MCNNVSILVIVDDAMQLAKKEWTVNEIENNLVMEAVRMALDGNHIGDSVESIICGEWRDHKLTEADLEELTAAYVKSLRACLGVLARL